MESEAQGPAVGGPESDDASAAPGGASEYIAAESIDQAIRELRAAPISSKGHTVLIGFLCLKAHGASDDGVTPVAASGSNSVRTVLDRYFRVADDAERPYLNPFGKLEWLKEGYERSGVYTHLYEARPLRPYVELIQDANGSLTGVSLVPDAAQKLAGVLRTKVPLEPAAAFLLRNIAFPASGGAADLGAALAEEFNLAEDERDALFETAPAFVVNWAPTAFENRLSSVSPDLRPADVKMPGGTTVTGTLTVVSKTEQPFDEIVAPPAVLRRLRRALATSSGVALAGPPGTGKSTLARQVVAEVAANPADLGFTQAPQMDDHTAEAGWTARTLIGGHYPVNGVLEFQPGIIPRAIEANRWLLIDEMNRADLDRVMGPLFSFLAGQDVDLGPSRLDADGQPPDVLRVRGLRGMRRTRASPQAPSTSWLGAAAAALA